MKLCKVVLGVKPNKRIFRATSLSGEVVDSIMEAVGGPVLPDEYFSRVHRNVDGSLIKLMDSEDDPVNSVSVDTDSIIFTKDHYGKNTRVDFDDVFKEFQAIWQACNAVLKITDVRRIGLVGEYRVMPPSSSSAALLNNLTKIQAGGGTTAKFQMQFETHQLTTGGTGLPDIKTGDFWNTNESYYDSVLDTEHSEPGQITVMLDVQRYYMPLLTGNVPDEARKLKKRYDDVVRQVRDRPYMERLDAEIRTEHVKEK